MFDDEVQLDEDVSVLFSLSCLAFILLRWRQISHLYCPVYLTGTLTRSNIHSNIMDSIAENGHKGFNRKGKGKCIRLVESLSFFLGDLTILLVYGSILLSTIWLVLMRPGPSPGAIIEAWGDLTTISICVALEPTTFWSGAECATTRPPLPFVDTFITGST